MHPYPELHRSVLRWVCCILRAIYFIRVPTRVKEVTQNLIKDIDVCELTCWVGALDPHQVPPRMLMLSS
jgi:hypothetical protein